jgi:hypothetical protein
MSDVPQRVLLKEIDGMAITQSETSQSQKALLSTPSVAVPRFRNESTSTILHFTTISRFIEVAAQVGIMVFQFIHLFHKSCHLYVSLEIFRMPLTQKLTTSVHSAIF